MDAVREEGLCGMGERWLERGRKPVVRAGTPSRATTVQDSFLRGVEGIRSAGSPKRRCEERARKRSSLRRVCLFLSAARASLRPAQEIQGKPETRFGETLRGGRRLRTYDDRILADLPSDARQLVGIPLRRDDMGERTVAELAGITPSIAGEPSRSAIPGSSRGSSSRSTVRPARARQESCCWTFVPPMRPASPRRTTARPCSPSWSP